MVEMTLSLRQFLWKFHRGIYTTVMFGHIELLSEEIKEEYIKWCKTDEGKSYLEGGSNYNKEEGIK